MPTLLNNKSIYGNFNLTPDEIKRNYILKVAS
jgi:hypothetical protein